MKKIFVKVFLFVLPCLIAYSMLEEKLSGVPNMYTKKQEFLESQLNQVEVLTTGSSHGDAINPDYIHERTFTLNQAAQDLYYDTRLVIHYLDRMPKLKLVIIPISYFSLEYQMDRTKTWTLAPYYFHTWRIPPQHWDSFLSWRYFSLTAAYGWEKALGYLQNGFQDNEWKIMKPTGWWLQGEQELEDTPHESEFGQYSIQMQHIEIMKVERIPESVRLLEELVRSCQARGVQVAFVTTPVHHSYSDFMDPQRWQTTQAVLQSLVERYHVVYKNYLSDPRFAEADFYSRDHVNTKGSKKFSQIIDAEIITPILSKETIF
jgi:hypothetical protein